MKLSIKIFDLIVAICLILLLGLPMLLIALFIKLTSKGPVIFKQKRIGFMEKEFYIYKFRTMSVGSSKHGSITIGNDNRITSLGKILRKTKIDEFPQLFNILKGEMSFVGPRPDTQEYTKYYINSNKDFFKLMPGITGKASIYLSNEEELMAKVADPKEFYIKKIIPQKVKLNIFHLENNNIFSNVLVMFETVFKIFKS